MIDNMKRHPSARTSLTVEEVTERLLAMPRELLRELADVRRIPHLIARGKISFEHIAVEEWLRARRVGSVSSLGEK